MNIKITNISVDEMKKLFGNKAIECKDVEMKNSTFDNLEKIKENESFIVKHLYVERATYDGMKFDELNLNNIKFHKVLDHNGKELFICDKVLFKSAISRNDSLLEFEQSELSVYMRLFLSKSLSEALGEKVECRLLYKDEVFGDGRLDFFKERKNRIAVDLNDDLSWWWLADNCSSGNIADYFCVVNDIGIANYYYADNAIGGVRPAFYKLEK